MKRIIASIGLFLVVVCVSVFVQWDINLGQWRPNERLFMVVMGAWLVVLLNIAPIWKDK